MKLITFKSFNTPVEAHIVKARLEDAGISCVLTNENMSAMTGVFNQQVSAVQLKIDPADLEKAHQILKEEF